MCRIFFIIALRRHNTKKHEKLTVVGWPMASAFLACLRKRLSPF